MDSSTQTAVLESVQLAQGLNALQHANVDLCQATIDGLSWPDNKSEYWKYTKLNAIKKLALKLPANSQPTKGSVIAFENGALSTVSESSDLRILFGTDLEQSPEFKNNFGRLSPWKTDVFAANNLLQSRNTLAIVCPKGKTIEAQKIEISSDVIELFENPRLLIVTEESSDLKLEITLKGIGVNTLRNLALEAFVNDNSSLEINILQEEGEKAFTVIQSDVEMKSDAFAKINYFNINTHWTRANSNFFIDGKNSDAQVNGIYLPKGGQFIDHHTLIHHALPHCTSHELYRGIIADNSKAVFNGKVLVSKDAQKTDAFQQNNNVILDENSTINAKPELEIYADDVKCSHGCTIGQLDDEAVYYLRARGIGLAKARAMVLNAFCEDVLDLISSEELKECISQKVADRLAEMH
jgi:Fe-S cluster assembly protein SufD